MKTRKIILVSVMLILAIVFGYGGYHYGFSAENENCNLAQICIVLCTVLIGIIFILSLKELFKAIDKNHKSTGG